MNAKGTPGESQGRQPADRPARTDEDRSSLPALTHGLLEQVLEEMDTERHTVAADSADLAALLQVVQRHRGQPLALEPILVELVEAMLTRQFAKTAPNEDWKSISREVAEKLFEDPRSQGRLHELWRRLSQRQT